MKTGIIYARSATANEMALQKQIAACMSFATDQDIQVCEIFTDIGSGSTLEEKNGLAHAIGLIATDNVECFIVADLSRISRETYQQYLITEMLNCAGCKFVCIDQYEEGTSKLRQTVVAPKRSASRK